MLSESNRVTIMFVTIESLLSAQLCSQLSWVQLKYGRNTKQTGSSEEFKIFSHSSVRSSLLQVSDLMIKVSYLLFVCLKFINNILVRFSTNIQVQRLSEVRVSDLIQRISGM